MGALPRAEARGFAAVKSPVFLKRITAAWIIESGIMPDERPEVVFAPLEQNLIHGTPAIDVGRRRPGIDTV